MQLNQGQTDAINKLNDWWSREDTDAISHPFVIDGLAGTGKTTLMREFLRQHERQLAGETVIGASIAHVAVNKLVKTLMAGVGRGDEPIHIVSKTIAQLTTRPQTYIKVEKAGRPGFQCNTTAELSESLTKQLNWGHKQVAAATKLIKHAQEEAKKHDGEGALGYLKMAELNHLDPQAIFSVETMFVPRDEPLPVASSAALIIIDEIGMVSQKLVKQLSEFYLRADTPCRLLVLGDSHQLYPVKENKFNSWLDDDYQLAFPAYHARLTEVVRQAGDQSLISSMAMEAYRTGNLAQAYSQACANERVSLAQATKVIQMPTPQTMDGWSMLCSDRAAGSQYVQSMIKSHYLPRLTSHGDSWAVLTYSNRTLRQLNFAFREAVNGADSGTDDGFRPGDKVIVSGATKITGAARNQQFLITNVHTTDEVKQLLQEPLLFNQYQDSPVQFVDLQDPQRPDEPVAQWVMVYRNHINGVVETRGNRTSIHWLDGRKINELEGFNEVQLLHDLGHDIYAQIILNAQKLLQITTDDEKELADRLRKYSKSNQKNNFEAKMILNYLNGHHWYGKKITEAEQPTYYKLLILQLSFAMTVYKAQGQEYDHVLWVHEGWLDHASYINRDQLKHILYTTITRTKKTFEFACGNRAIYVDGHPLSQILRKVAI